ncbi:MAG TPA: anhydro-N-acetylmuramic acid kinase [Candidatus Acidoferrales bacterium]|nr:anhydro-N-acetylmuramic acid kinase [Candidatus Acidoferrales bacterium]
MIGLMSGTSADGIDVALAEISGAPPHLKSRLENFTAIPYPRKVREAVLRVAEGTRVNTAEISQLNFLLGELFADAVREACRRFRVPLAKVKLIGSHGQTVYHQGKPSLAFGVRRVASTLQIAEPAVIAARTEVTTVGDFRGADMAVGGQGAPLVPFVDYLLFRHARLGRVALNIGGIANLTVIPAGAKPSDVFAFDTGPGNMLIDALVSRATRGKQTFDRDAAIALRGNFRPRLCEMLLRDAYYRQAPPKSAGREQYGAKAVDRILMWGRKHAAPTEDLIRTATIFTPLTIIDAWHRFVMPRAKISQLIVAGGGSHNPLIMAQLTASLPDVKVMTSADLGVPEDGKEAFAFAILAYETFHRRPANLPSATGASRPPILGKICYPPHRAGSRA